MSIEKMNSLGGFLTIFILSTCILVFIFRLMNWKNAEYWTGLAFVLSIIPLTYILFVSFNHERPTLFFIQLGLMIGFIILEFLLDYVLKFDFRHVKWMVITYTTIFFASTGGMIGVASKAGNCWTIASVLLFFVMFGLAFYQRAKTGL